MKRANLFIMAGVVFIILFFAIVPSRRLWMPASSIHHHYTPYWGHGWGHGWNEYFADSGATFKMFGVDWCPHCVSAKPEFEKLGSTMTIGGHTVSLQVVNPETDPASAKGYDIRGYPRFFLDSAGGGRQEYKGPRTADGFRQFLNEKLQ